MLAAARDHLASINQPDTMTTHLEFISATRVGPAIITVQEVKVGRRLSKLHISLWQGKGILTHAPWVSPSVTKCVILEYATQINLSTFTGMSFPMGFREADAQTRLVKPNLDALLDKGSDNVWAESLVPEASRSLLKSLQRWRMFVPCYGLSAPGVMDMWMCTRNGELITQAFLPYAVDSFPFDMYIYLAPSELRAMLARPPQKDASEGEKAQREGFAKKLSDLGNLWFPTVVMNLENKIALPDEGVGWLNLRITTKVMDNGKFDLDILVRNEDEEIVALSHHVSLMVSMERNVSNKKPQAVL